MNPDILDIGLPGWEVIHIFQDAASKGVNTVLLLRGAKSTGETLAVDKIVPFPSPILYRAEEDELINDATILAEMPPHPNIIKLYSSHLDVPAPGLMSFIFEFCAGGDFRDLSAHALQSGVRIPEPFFWHVLHQTWAALEYMHRYGISHNDVHIGNLFLRPVIVGGAGAEGEQAYPDVVLGDFEAADLHLPPDEPSDDFRTVASEIDFLIHRMANRIVDPSHPYSAQLMELYKSLFVDGGKPKPVNVEREHELVMFSKTMAYGDSNGMSHRMPPWMTEYFCHLGRKFDLKH